MVVETETHRDWTKVVETETLTRLFQKVLQISTGWPLDKMKRNQTNIYCSNFDFQGCRYRDQSRLDNLVVVETETDRDWTKVVETETLTRLSRFSALYIKKE